MADPNSAVTPLLLIPSRGITAMFDPITAEKPRIPRYSRNPHYRTALYCRSTNLERPTSGCDVCSVVVSIPPATDTHVTVEQYKVFEV